MIQRAIDRRRATSGSLTASFALHALVLLTLGLFLAREVVGPEATVELTEIAYLESLPGDDIEEMVRQEIKAEPGPPGPGIATDSAVKPQDKAAPEMDTPASPPETKSEPRPVPRPEVRPEPAPVLAAAEAPAPVVREAPARPTEARTLTRNEPPPARKKFVAPTRDRDQPRAATVARGPEPVTTTSPDREAVFEPREPGLKSKTGRVLAGDDALVDSRAGARSSQVAEAPATVAGGSLTSRKGAPSYAMAGAALKPASGNRDARGVGDVDGPAASNSSGKRRRTVLDYGTGGGGSGGSLRGKGRLAEPKPSPAVASRSADQDAAPAVAEAKLDANGVNMSITGQIQGRQILKSAPATYTDLARRKGWEGVVAVHFTVLADGRVKDNLYFEQTSVHRDLNQAAMAAIRQFRFAPLPSGQAAVEQWGVITIVFRLK